MNEKKKLDFKIIKTPMFPCVWYRMSLIGKKKEVCVQLPLN